MAILISDDNPGKGTWVKDFVDAVLDADPEKPPQLLLNVDADVLADVRKMVEKKAPSPRLRELWLSALTLVPSRNSWNWQQDFLHSYVENGQPRTRLYTDYGWVEGSNDSVRNENVVALGRAEIQTLAETCGIPAGPDLKQPGYDTRYYKGGNVQGGPGGSCVLGSFEEKRWEALALDLCGPAAPKIHAPAEAMTVGHADEIFTTFRTGTGRCDVAVGIISPRASIAALRKRPGDLAFPFLESEVAAAKKHGQDISAYIASTFALICDGLTEKLRHLEHDYQTCQRSSPAEVLPKEQFELLHRIAGQLLNRETYFDNYEKVAAACYNRIFTVTNAELADMLEGDTEIGRRNREVQAELDEFHKQFEHPLGGCPVPKIVDLPMPIDLRKQAGFLFGGSPYFSNPANSQQVGQTWIVGDPRNQALRDAYERIPMDNHLNVKTRLLDSSAFQDQQGGIHCATNAIRYCRPPRKP